MFRLECENANLYNDFIDSLHNPFRSCRPKDEKEVKLLRLFDWRSKLINRLNRARYYWQTGCKNDCDRSQGVIYQLKSEKLGNCGEDAFLSALILKLNGVKNACMATLKSGKEKVDHVVCVFNKDGSAFDGKVSKNTIIIDPWVGTADFASNMFLKYKALAKKYFYNIKPDSKLGFENVRQLDLSDRQKLRLCLENDNLIYPSEKRDLMK